MQRCRRSDLLERFWPVYGYATDQASEIHWRKMQNASPPPCALAQENVFYFFGS